MSRFGAREGRPRFLRKFAWLAGFVICEINQLSADERTITNWGVTIGKIKRFDFNQSDHGDPICLAEKAGKSVRCRRKAC